MTARPRRSRRAGFTLIEMLIGVSLIVMITTAVLNLGVVAARTASRSRVRTTNSAHARATLDEVLRQTRAASQVLTSASVAGATVATGDTNLVLQTPSYDAGSAGVLLASKTDTVAFRFDAQAKTITQSTAPAVGSQCPVRSALVVARNVSAVAYTYYAQDEFTGDGTTSAFVLSARSRRGLSRPRTSTACRPPAPTPPRRAPRPWSHRPPAGRTSNSCTSSTRPPTAGSGPPTPTASTSR
jgi:prepilin-type N-terminal cleavage/methylation domain-containing protein